MSTLWVGPAQAQNDIIPPRVVVTTPGGISLSDGNYTFNETDLRAGTLTFERTYSAPQTGAATVDDTKFGTAMNHNYNIFVLPSMVPPRSGVPQHAKATVHIGARTVGSYLQDTFSGTVGAFTNDSGDAGGGILELVSGNYRYTDAGGVIYNFTSSYKPDIVFGVSSYTPNGQKVSNVQFPDGRVWNFFYDTTSKLKAVVDSRGYAIVLDYNGSSQIATACGYDSSSQFVDASTSCVVPTNKVSYGYSSRQHSAMSCATVSMQRPLAF